MRRPRDLRLDRGCYSVTVEGEVSGLNAGTIYGRLDFHEGITSVLFTPSEARRLANWLLRYAEWATEKKK